MRNQAARKDGRRGRTRLEEDYGRGEHTIIGAEAGALVLDGRRVARQVLDVFGAPGYRAPVLPAVAMEVQRLLQSPTVAMPAVVALIETDALIAAEVLRIAQTPAYVTRVPPGSLRDAVSRLGLNTIRDLVFEAALKSKLFQSPGYGKIMDRLRRHSVVTAHLARLLAKQTKVSQLAFMCGLLHDVGLAAVLIALEQLHPREPAVALGVLGGELGPLHEQAGKVVARLWDLPPNVARVVGDHHDPGSNLGAAVCIAQAAANEVGASVAIAGTDFEETDLVVLARCAELIGLSPDAHERFRQEARAMLEGG